MSQFCEPRLAWRGLLMAGNATATWYAPSRDAAVIEWSLHGGGASGTMPGASRGDEAAVWPNAKILLAAPRTLARA